METKTVDPIPITDEALKTALHLVRVVFAEWMLQEFPLHGADCFQIMSKQGLCTQQEANDAIVDASHRLAIAEAPEPFTFAFDGSAEDAEGGYLAAEMENNLRAAVFPWDAESANAIGEMHTVWSQQFQRNCVVAYFDEGDADKIIAHCRHMGAVAREGADEAFVVVLRPDIGPELYSEEAIRRGAEQFNREYRRAEAKWISEHNPPDYPAGSLD